MTDRFKIGNGVEVISLAQKRAKVDMVLPHVGPYGVGALSTAKAGLISMSMSDASIEALKQLALQPTDPGPQSIEQILPRDSDYIYALFRALSAVLIPGYWVDFSMPGVLQKATPLFFGQTIYKNHGDPKGLWGLRELDVEKWIGAVSQAEWDAKGDKVDGNVPGVNVEMKIDAVENRKIARGLLMKPPAIHSCSETVLFNFDYSHPDLVEQERFWRMLGEEVEGEIVRFKVTEIIKLSELSLVYQGADGIAKQIETDREPDEELSEKRQGRNFGAPPARIADKKEKHTVKLTAEQKTALGITHEGEDVPDAVVISMATSLAQRATSADAIVGAARTEVLRLATLAEGSGEGEARKLDPAITALIEQADPSQLPGLTTLYQEKAAKAFPLTCEFGHSAVRGRSSVDNPETAKDLAADAEEDTHLL